MGKLIQDIVPPVTRKMRRMQLQTDANYLFHVDTDVIVTELAMRGVTVRDIFGMYYALEEMASAHSDQVFGNDEDGLHGNMQPITVEDAELAGVAILPDEPNLNPQPF